MSACNQHTDIHRASSVMLGTLAELETELTMRSTT